MRVLSITPGEKKLGFIGIGLMGRRIAQRLLDHGYKPLLPRTGTTPRRKHFLEAVPASRRTSPAELASRADVILLSGVFSAVERACKENHHRPLEEMVEAVVHAFVDAKLARKDTSLALYAVAPDLNRQVLVAELTKKAQSAMCSMLKTAPGIRFSQVEFPVFVFFSSMVGATRAVLEGGASRKMEEDLRRPVGPFRPGLLEQRSNVEHPNPPNLQVKNYR